MMLIFTSNVKFHTDAPLVAESTGLHRTYMDSLGRTSIELVAMNVIDELRDRKVIVSYDYSLASLLRKPVTIIAGFVGVFATSWLVSLLDVSIGKKKA